MTFPSLQAYCFTGFVEPAEMPILHYRRKAWKVGEWYDCCTCCSGNLSVMTVFTTFLVVAWWHKWQLCNSIPLENLSGWKKFFFTAVWAIPAFLIGANVAQSKWGWKSLFSMDGVSQIKITFFYGGAWKYFYFYSVHIFAKRSNVFDEKKKFRFVVKLIR